MINEVLGDEGEGEGWLRRIDDWREKTKNDKGDKNEDSE